MSRQLVVGSDVVAIYSQGYLDYIIAQKNSPIYSVCHPNSVDMRKHSKSSAANFVSRILSTYGMIIYPHVQIKILLDEMKLSGWVEYKRFEINDLIPGDVVVWEQDRYGHYHIGFVHENNLAVSFCGKGGFPTLHDLDFQDLWHGSKRKIISRFTFENKR